MTGTWATGWQTGDVEQAAEFKKGIGAIFDQTFVSTTSLTIGSIPATYAHLLLVVYARSDVAAASASLGLQFNSDVGANYDFQRLTGAAATAAAAESFAQTSAAVGLMPANTAGANLFSANILFIPNYASASNNKLAIALSSFRSGTTTTTMTTSMHAGFWRSNAAITQITLSSVSGNLVTGTRVTLYGMGA